MPPLEQWFSNLSWLHDHLEAGSHTDCWASLPDAIVLECTARIYSSEVPDAAAAAAAGGLGPHVENQCSKEIKGEC